jgi:hypothetical protein
MVAKSFPRKQVGRQKVLRINFFRNFLWLQNHSPKSMFAGINFAKHFFWLKIFVVAKLFPRKQVGRQKFLR